MRTERSGAPSPLTWGPGRARAHYQTFIRWTRLGVWERLLHLAQERGVQLGMTFLGATSIRAHYLAEPRADLPFATSRGGEGGPGHPTNPISQAWEGLAQAQESAAL
jgi:hypothetical protein